MRVRLTLGTLPEQQADVIVRVAPATLVGRGGKELLAAAGPDVARLCTDLRRTSFPRGLPVAEAVPTPAGRLAATWLVHIVPPEYSVRQDRSHLLTACYRACVQAADELGAATLAMPAFGATPPYWPLPEAVRLGLLTLGSTPTRLRETRLVLSSAAALEYFAEALARQ